MTTTLEPCTRITPRVASTVRGDGSVHFMPCPLHTVKRLLEERRAVQWLTEILSGRPPRDSNMRSPRGAAVCATPLNDLNFRPRREMLLVGLRLVP